MKWVTKYKYDLIICAVFLAIGWFIAGRSSGTSSSVITETDRLYKKNDELLQTIINQHEQAVEYREAEIDALKIYRDELVERLLELDHNYNHAKTIGNEKINRVSSYTDADILRYLADYDTTRAR